jgi:hypothetical protein
VTGGLEVTAGVLLLIPATSRAGAIGSVAILLAAVMTLIRHRDWKHLPGAVALTAVAVAVTIRDRLGGRGGGVRVARPRRDRQNRLDRRPMDEMRSRLERPFSYIISLGADWPVSANLGPLGRSACGREGPLCTESRKFKLRHYQLAPSSIASTRSILPSISISVLCRAKMAQAGRGCRGLGREPSAVRLETLGRAVEGGSRLVLGTLG